MEPPPSHPVKLYITIGCYSIEPPPSHPVNYMLQYIFTLWRPYHYTRLTIYYNTLLLYGAPPSHPVN